MDDKDAIQLITGLSPRERKRVLVWVAALTEEQVVEIFHGAVKLAYQIRSERSDMPGKIIKYCAFILAARKAGWDTVRGKGYRVAEERQFDDFSHIRQAKAAALMQRGRTPVLRRKILAYWGEVKELKGEGMGFRPIADYLSKTRKLKTSASYLAQLWKDVEQGGEK